MDDKPKRRWYQFSLRKLLVAIALLSVAMGWLGWESHIAERRHALMNEIQRAGGHVLTLDYSANQNEKLAQNKDIPWLRRVGLDDRAASLVELPNDKFLSDQELMRIKEVLPEAKIIRLPKNGPAASPPAAHES